MLFRFSAVLDKQTASIQFSLRLNFQTRFYFWSRRKTICLFGALKQKLIAITSLNAHIKYACSSEACAL